MSVDSQTPGETLTLRRAAWYLATGLGLLLAVLAFLPGFAGLVPAEVLVDLLGNDYFVLGSFAALALVAVLVMLTRRALGSVSQAAPPDPETRIDAPRPGVLFDRFLDTWSAANPYASTQGEDRVREQLRTSVQTAMMRVEGLSRDAAADRIIEGDWTDDPVAARFLRTDAEATPSLGDRLRLALRGERWSQYGARRAASALVQQYGDASEEGKR